MAYHGTFLRKNFSGVQPLVLFLVIVLNTNNNYNMKKGIIIAFVFLAFTLGSIAQQYKVITVIESVVPMGLGRSRIIDGQDTTDYRAFTTSRTKGNESKQNEVDRQAVRIDNMEETKLLNFYSGVGINFQNVASNDAVITSKLNEMAKDGWFLVFVTSGVESDAGREDGKGIFITRFIFKKTDE